MGTTWTEIHPLFKSCAKDLLVEINFWGAESLINLVNAIRWARALAPHWLHYTNKLAHFQLKDRDKYKYKYKTWLYGESLSSLVIWGKSLAFQLEFIRAHASQDLYCEAPVALRCYFFTISFCIFTMWGSFLHFSCRSAADQIFYIWLNRIGGKCASHIRPCLTLGRKLAVPSIGRITQNWDLFRITF